MIASPEPYGKTDDGTILQDDAHPAGLSPDLESDRTKAGCQPILRI